MDKEKRLRKNIGKILDEWKPRLWLSDWDISVSLVKKVDGSARYVTGACWANWQYKEANIQLKKKQVIEMEYDILEKALVHEMVHCLVSEMHDMATDKNHMEVVVTNLTMAFRRAYK